MSTATLSQAHKPRPTTRLPWAFVALIALAACLLVLAFGFIAFQLYFSARVLPGVSVWHVDLSNKTLADAAAALDVAFQAKFNTARVDLSDGQRAWIANPIDLGIYFDAQATAQAALELSGRGVEGQTQVLFNGAELAPRIVFNSNVARAYFEQMAAQINRPPLDAGLQLDGTNVITTPAQIGRELNVEAALKLLPDLAKTDGPKRIVLPIDTQLPRLTDVSAAAAQLQQVLNRNMTLVLANPALGEPASWDLTPQQLLSFLRVDKAADGMAIEVKFNEDALRAGLADLAQQIDQAPENARFIFNDDTRQLEVIQPGKIGRALDITTTATRMNEALARGDQQVALVVNEQRPDFYDDASAANLGITELVSSGQSFYAGSSEERMKNIRAASASQHGVIVKPGETFSFNDNLGDVSLDTGYAEALIIYNGRTIKGVGGGVCQVSTTAFRAAFTGGYPIIERWPHAYRVGWYERGAGPGLDASVFSPYVDFKFQNDTPYHILIEAYANDVAGRLTFKFYSTSDGRQVTISEPIVENVIPHPEDKLEEDPTLPAGTRQQVDYAADGADVTVKRTVTRNGQVVSEDRVFTRYQPWQAIFKVGTGGETP
ncbi:Vancomycin B-type resistance protein VanW [Thermoflexales bacterium]|nr:Vancomycin B-type resistance protein VanW [Thermoflexales bacterium]